MDAHTIKNKCAILLQNTLVIFRLKKLHHKKFEIENNLITAAAAIV